MKVKLVNLMVLSILFASGGLWAAAKNITVQVNGMVCAFCSQGITKKFSGHPSIQTVNVDMAKKEVALSLKENKSISDDEITQLITDAGISVDKIVR